MRWLTHTDNISKQINCSISNSVTKCNRDLSSRRCNTCPPCFMQNDKLIWKDSRDRPRPRAGWSNAREAMLASMQCEMYPGQSMDEILIVPFIMNQFQGRMWQSIRCWHIRDKRFWDGRVMVFANKIHLNVNISRRFSIRSELEI